MAILLYVAGTLLANDNQQLSQGIFKSSQPQSSVLTQPYITSVGMDPSKKAITKLLPKGILRRWPMAIAIASWLYVAVLLALWTTVAMGSDRWCVATVLMFGPRWLWAAPLAILLPVAAVWRRRLLILILAIMLLALGPVTGFCLPWCRWQPAEPSTFHMRVLTCNVHRGELKPDDLGHYIAQTMPDVIALQDWTSKNEKAVFWQQDWHIRRVEEICLASRFPINRVEDISGETSDNHGALIDFELETPIGPLHFLNLHLASPRSGLEDVLDREGLAELKANSERRRRQSELARDWAGWQTGPLLIAGDFNTPTDSTIYQAIWSSYMNAFSRAGFGWGHTYYTRRTSIRIDHLLAGSGWDCRRSWVGPYVGSAHRPLVADWDWVQQ
jgi:endonuclease/exonuclease/phosphatase (EEP) superfamily protein YafD